MAAPPTSPSPAPPSTAGVHANVVPSEVGWQFVPQYYTFVNKSPNRLHMFYTKNSTFIHGTEGEDGRACYGQQVSRADCRASARQDASGPSLGERPCKRKGA